MNKNDDIIQEDFEGSSTTQSIVECYTDGGKPQCNLNIENINDKTKMTCNIEGEVYNPSIKFDFEPEPNQVTPIGININPDGVIYDISEGEYRVTAKVVYEDAEGRERKICSEDIKISTDK